jgi:D-aminopeptidase
MNNSITDVAGISVGHHTIDAGDVQTGATVILPYPQSVRDRKLFIGNFASSNWQSWTGLQVARDFGTFSSPILLCNATTIGVAYDALITYSYQRAADLPIDNAWPPLVIGMDDGYLNDQRQRPVTHDAILDLVNSAGDGPAKCGSVGIGRGLCALGGKGGVGDASRAVKLGEEEAIIGVLIAANGGRFADEGSVDRSRSLTPSTVLITATNAPLLPMDLSALAEAALRGLDESIDFDIDDRQLALAFSTSNRIDHAFEEEFHLKPVRQYARAQLSDLFDAGAETARAALRRALVEAKPVLGRKGRRLERVEVSRLPSGTWLR